MIPTMLIAAIFAIARIWIGFNIEPDSFTWIAAYKDAAHLFMGGLTLSAWLAQPGSWSSLMFWKVKLCWQWQVFWFLNVVEVITAILSRT